MDWKKSYNRFKEYWAGSQPPEVPYEEQIRQAEALRRQSALDALTARTERLRPIVNRLLLVTDFGNYAQNEHTHRLGDAILADGIFAPDMPIGFSAHIIRSRHKEARLWPTETAFRISHELYERGLNALPDIKGFGIENEYDEWLETIASAAEGTAEQADMPLEQVGHIAVVGSLELVHAGIRDVFTLTQGDNGAAFQLTQIGDRGSMSWALVSADMGS